MAFIAVHALSHEHAIKLPRVATNSILKLVELQSKRKCRLAKNASFVLL